MLLPKLFFRLILVQILNYFFSRRTRLGNVNKCPYSIRFWISKSQSLATESSPITPERGSRPSFIQCSLPFTNGLGLINFFHCSNSIRTLIAGRRYVIVSVTRLGNLLHFGQLFKACCNKYFAQNAQTLMQIFVQL